MKAEHEATLRRALRDGFNLFLGSGFSVLARNAARAPMPTGRQLAVELRAHFGVDREAELDLPRLATIVAATRRDELRTFLTARFTVADFDARYTQLRDLPVQTIFTTNIDDLCFRIYERSLSYYLNDLDVNGPAFRGRHAVDYIALHGSVRDDARPYRFSPTELASSFSTDPDRWRYLRRRLSTAPTLFWGYSLSDAGTLEALAGAGDLASSHSPRWIVVPPDVGATHREYFAALGLSLILGDTASCLDGVRDLTLQRRRTAPLVPARQQEALQDLLVPDVTRIVRRSFDEFILGSAPTWSDVYSAQLARTTHFTRVCDRVLSGRRVIIAGIPACGKTTLLMQIAAHLPHDGLRLMLDSPTQPRADLILRALNGADALVCVDNCTQNVASFVALAGAPHVTLVGADRDFYVSTARDRADLARENIAVENATPLTAGDLQLLRDSIPMALRRRRRTDREMARGTQRSIFEFIQANVRAPSLDRRFRQALRKLAIDDSRKAELLLFVAYVHYCRTPVSLDMVIGYFSDETRVDYEALSAEVKAVGDILQEYADELTDGQQDYFTTRSTIAGEAVLAAASSSALAAMLRKFHENLSSIRITAYGAFRRRAFGPDLFARAFPAWREGAAIYDDIYARDLSPQTLRYKALYLSKLGEHQLAFETIEAAIASTRHINWIIRNAHAQILFGANIGRYQAVGAREQLERAMAVLSHCYASDRRKIVHVLVFADFALEFAAAFRDVTSFGYLERAQEWLEAAHQHEPWLARVPRLLRQISGVLSDLESAGASL
jgi:tetratricopeptide (TPR) repeat protein